MLLTRRLRLEPWAPEHAGLLARLGAMPEVTRHIGAGATWPAPMARQLHAERLVHWRTRGFGWRAMIERRTGAALGLIALNSGDGVPGLAPEDLEIGWWLDPAHWGRGYAVEGATAVRDEAFGRLAAAALVARIQPANSASIRVALALGLEPAGETTGRFGETVALYRRLRPG